MAGKKAIVCSLFSTTNTNKSEIICRTARKKETLVLLGKLSSHTDSHTQPAKIYTIECERKKWFIC